MRMCYNLTGMIKFLERIAGEPFKRVVSADSVPCIEQSDPERLCRDPLVSIHMVTYNHERYIRQAIEGVLNQRTDFAYEVVIGEDASTDRTREICFEYQRRYPEKIRVLWSEENQYAVAGNVVRVNAACRGKYIAYCEGDDYWTNPDKLQLQIDAFRANPNLGICLMGTDVEIESTGERRLFDVSRNFSGTLPAGRRASDFVLFRRRMNGFRLRRTCYQTSGWMVARQALEEVTTRLADLYAIRLAFGDTRNLAALTEWYDALFIGCTGSVYRVNSGSVSFTQRTRLQRDVVLLKIYWLVKLRGWPRLFAVLRYWLKILGFYGRKLS